MNRKRKAERIEAELARPLAPAPVKAKDCFPAKVAAKLCGLCAFTDCESASPTLTDCADFVRRTAEKVSVETVLAEPKPAYNHQNRKAYALASYRNQLLVKWQQVRAEMHRLERELASVEKDIHREAVVVTICPAYAPPQRLFRSALPEKPEAGKPSPAKKTKKISDKQWDDLELD